MTDNSQSMIPLQQPWQSKFPATISGIFSFIQFLVTVVIIGCEVGSILIDMVTATIYVGFWASLFFIAAWISQSATSCCCRSRGCATYTLIIQCISLLFAACVIGFDSYYIMYPGTCFFSSTICYNIGSARGLFYSVSNFNNIKIPLIKGQLAAGAVMFVLCLVYITIYIITHIRVNKDKQSSTVYPQVQNSWPTIPTVSNGMMTVPPYVTNNGDGRITQLVCPECKTTLDMAISKRIPM